MKKSQHPTNKPNIALVHDFLLYPGGAEKVLVDLARMFPEAPIYTLVRDDVGIERIDGAFGGNLSERDIRTSFVDRLPALLKKHPRRVVPLLATAAESLDLRDFDIVVSSSGAWTKGVVTRTHTRHIAYLHSPMRFVWDMHEQYFADRRERASVMKRLFVSHLRLWDTQAASRPDILVTNSEYSRRRIAKYYRRESAVVYPGVYDERHIYPIRKGGERFLVVSRLHASKRVDRAIEVANKLALPLTVVGYGPEFRRLRRMSGPTVDVRGWLSPKELERIYTKARALLFPAPDDFGIAPVEAQLRGVPTIAVPGGSAAEIVADGISGLLCDAPTVGGLADGVRRFLEREEAFQPERIAEHARRFSTRTFCHRINDLVYGNA